MKIGLIKEIHRFDPENGAVSGGETVGTGFVISWQDGPLGKRDGNRQDPNGAFVEDVIDAVIGRIMAFQNTKFACEENAEALEHLKTAAAALDRRTQRRVLDKTEGTYEGK